MFHPIVNQAPKHKRKMVTENFSIFKFNVLKSSAALGSITGRCAGNGQPRPDTRERVKSRIRVNLQINKGCHNNIETTER